MINCVSKKQLDAAQHIITVVQWDNIAEFNLYKVKVTF